MHTPDEHAIEVLRQYHPHVRDYKPMLLGRLVADTIKRAVEQAYADCEEIIDYSYGSGSGVEAVLELLHRHRDKALGKE